MDYLPGLGQTNSTLMGHRTNIKLSKRQNDKTTIDDMDNIKDCLNLYSTPKGVQYKFKQSLNDLTRNLWIIPAKFHSHFCFTGVYTEKKDIRLSNLCHLWGTIVNRFKENRDSN